MKLIDFKPKDKGSYLVLCIREEGELTPWTVVDYCKANNDHKVSLMMWIHCYYNKLFQVVVDKHISYYDFETNKLLWETFGSDIIYDYDGVRLTTIAHPTNKVSNNTKEISSVEKELLSLERYL